MLVGDDIIAVTDLANHSGSQATGEKDFRLKRQTDKQVRKETESFKTLCPQLLLLPHLPLLVSIDGFIFLIFKDYI